MDLICFKLYFSKIKTHKSHFYISQPIHQTPPIGQDGRKNGTFQNNWNQQKSIKSDYEINKNFKLTSSSV